jgi:hypothetical protein
MKGAMLKDADKEGLVISAHKKPSVKHSNNQNDSCRESQKSVGLQPPGQKDIEIEISFKDCHLRKEPWDTLLP